MGDEGKRAALRTAVAAADSRSARRALAEISDAGSRSEALELLADLASAGSTLGIELLLELVDEAAVARRAVQRFILDEAAVEDVTQETLISVARSIRSFRGEARFTTWLHQLARNRAADHLRRERATVPLDEEDHVPDAGQAARMSSLVASHAAVQNLLSRLPAPYDEVVRMRDIDKRSYEEMVDSLGRNLNTVRSQVARGRALLAAVVEREGTA